MTKCRSDKCSNDKIQVKIGRAAIDQFFVCDVQVQRGSYFQGQVSFWGVGGLKRGLKWNFN